MSTPAQKFPQPLKAHLQSANTTLCRAWAVTRTDGQTYGFTDHDLDLSFEGVTFKADTGLTAQALEQTTGLAVDNTESLGALSSIAVSEEDIEAGRFDGARVKSWLVNWKNPQERVVQFNGAFGEITRVAGGFRAELRGLTELLNQPQGRVYHRAATVAHGQPGCGYDLDDIGFFTEVAVEEVEEGRIFRFADLTDFDHRWFERGRLIVLSGASQGLSEMIKLDRLSDAGRHVELWEGLRGAIAPGDLIRLEAGCATSAREFKLRHGDLIDFSGFPHIPGDDWTTAYPSGDVDHDGGSLFGGATQFEVTN